MKLKFELAALSNLILLLSCSIRINSDLSSDSNALLEFIEAVPHVRVLNWNASNPICTSWIGITCSKDRSRVSGLHLPGIGLYGPIPPNTIAKLDALRVLSLRSNYLNGDLSTDILSLPSLQALYLQHNNFSGGIPLSLSPRLTVLDLSYNFLTGEIPPSVMGLKRLTVLNLESNSLSGNIPNLDTPTLVLLNLSQNLLTGSIPQPLEKFPSSSFTGNSHLCGPPLAYCTALSPSHFPTPAVSKTESEGKKLSKGSIVAIAVGSVAFLVFLVLAYVLCCLKKKDLGDATRVIKVKTTGGVNTENLKSEDFGSGVQGGEKIKLTVLEGCSFNFDLEDLLRASAEVLGKGTYGTTYKAILDETTTVAVKRLKDVGIGKKEFDQHMELVGRVGRHPNVVPLLAYYCSKDEKLLVYEYMPSSSLSAALHGNREAAPLDWDSRLNIALGGARGLAHIHSESGARFIHGNIKASNILLRGGLDGCVSDFGLMMGFNADVKYRVAGYRAPEVIESKKATQKSDVYSFGVVVLEMLTGKSPLSVRHEEVVDLPRWVRSVVREEWTAEVFDAELIKCANIEEELVQMLQIALCCVAKLPEMRPSMDQVVEMIQRIRHPDVESRPSEEDNRSTPSHDS